MARPTNKTELLDAASAEFEKLWSAVDDVSQADRTKPGACEAWSVKDLLAHLDAWHELFLGWESVGRTGGKPQIPAAGYTFGETPALNESIYQRCRSDSWNDVDERLRSSHERAVVRIQDYEAEELFTKKRFAWTGTTSVGSYATSATSSHYAWASKHIRRWVKAQGAASA